LPVLYFSLEMSAEDLSVLIASRTLKINYMDLFRGMVSNDDRSRLRHLRHRWHRDPPPLSIVDIPGKVTMVEVHRELENYKTQHKMRPAIVYIDYVGLMSPLTSKKLETHEKLGELCRDLKQLARDWEVPMVTALQLNRESVKAERRGLEHISLSDLAGHHCDAIYGISLKDPDAEASAVSLEFIKQRYGSKRPLMLYVNWPCTYMGEMPAVVRQQLEAEERQRKESDDKESD